MSNLILKARKIVEVTDMYSATSVNIIIPIQDFIRKNYLINRIQLNVEGINDIPYKIKGGIYSSDNNNLLNEDVNNTRIDNTILFVSEIFTSNFKTYSEYECPNRVVSDGNLFMNLSLSILCNLNSTNVNLIVELNISQI